MFPQKMFAVNPRGFSPVAFKDRAQQVSESVGLGLVVLPEQVTGDFPVWGQVLAQFQFEQAEDLQGGFVFLFFQEVEQIALTG